MDPTFSSSLDRVDALDIIVADIPAIQFVREAVKATPPGVPETYGADLR